MISTTRVQKQSVALHRARAEVSRRDAHIAELKRSHRRLRHLYSISKLCVRFQTVDRTLPAVIALIARSIPLRSATLFLDDGPTPVDLSWQLEGDDPLQVENARAHLRGIWSYLAPANPRAHGPPQQIWFLPRAARRQPAPSSFVVLPLAIERDLVFGCLQLEAASPLYEADLVFFNSVVNQLAFALDRQLSSAAMRAAAEADLKEQRLLADLTAAMASSLDGTEILTILGNVTVSSLADVCLFDEVGEDGRLVRRIARVSSAVAPGAWTERLLALESHTPARVATSRLPVILQGGNSAVVSALSSEAEQTVFSALGVSSLIVVPLCHRGRCLGVLTLGRIQSERSYTLHDLALTREVADRAAVSLEHARLYEMARRATAARDNLLAIVSHDLKNPLSVISMALGLLMKNRSGHERRGSRSQLQAIQRSTVRMARLIDDLLQTASIEAGKLTMERRPIDLSPLIRDVIDSQQLHAGASKVRVLDDLLSALPAVFADASRVQQVLANLIGNAIKFTPAGGSVTVRACVTADSVVLSVADTGPGLQQEELPHLFERFWQARKTANLGTGLGLFIVKGIVEAHGGKVWAESTPGKGATFFVSLPRSSEPVVDPPTHGPGLLSPPLQLSPGEPIEPMARAGTRLDWLTVVSHEIRTPLAGLAVLLERLQRDRQATFQPEQRWLLARMFQAIDRLDGSTEELLQWAQLRNGTFFTRPAVFDVGAVLSSGFQTLRGRAEDAGLALRLNHPAEIPLLQSDPEVLRMMLIRLGRNAIHCTERGFVELGVSYRDGEHRIWVTDSGPGVPEAARERIFEPFTTTVETSHRYQSGLGLGLTVVREAARTLGGRIELVTEEGQGSTFTIVLPSMTLSLARQEPR